MDFIKNFIKKNVESVNTFATEHPKLIISVSGAVSGAFALLCLIFLIIETSKDDKKENQKIVRLTGFGLVLFGIIFLVSFLLYLSMKG